MPPSRPCESPFSPTEGGAVCPIDRVDPGADYRIEIGTTRINKIPHVKSRRLARKVPPREAFSALRVPWKTPNPRTFPHYPDRIYSESAVEVAAKF